MPLSRITLMTSARLDESSFFRTGARSAGTLSYSYSTGMLVSPSLFSLPLLTSPLAGPRLASTRQRPRITASPGLARRRRLVSRTNRRASPDTWSGRRGRGRSTRQLLQQDKQLVHVEGFGQDRAPLPLQIAGALLQGALISRAHQDRRRVEHGVRAGGPPRPLSQPWV